MDITIEYTGKIHAGSRIGRIVRLSKQIKVITEKRITDEKNRQRTRKIESYLPYIEVDGQGYSKVYLCRENALVIKSLIEGENSLFELLEPEHMNLLDSMLKPTADDLEAEMNSNLTKQQKAAQTRRANAAKKLALADKVSED